MPHKAPGKETSRKDKRRTNLENRVRKITDTFINDRDIYYKERLTSLQTDLTTLHQGNNALFQRKLRDLEEDRDYQLVQLRLHEEYRVARSKIEFEEDIKKAKEDYEKLVKLCKERLYAKLEMRVKKLKEERLLMDVANVHSYAMDYSRPLYHKNTRSHTINEESGVSHLLLNDYTPGEHRHSNFFGWESSPNDHIGDYVGGPAGASGTTNGFNDNVTDTGLLERRQLRRRNVARDAAGRTGAATDYYYHNGNVTDNPYIQRHHPYNSAYNDITDESDSRAGHSTAQRTGNGYHSASYRSDRGGTKSGVRLANGKDRKSEFDSDLEALQGISDYEDLQVLLFGSREKPSDNKKKHRSNPRYSTKYAPPLPSLTQEEVTSDIALLKASTGQEQPPFKLRST